MAERSIDIVAGLVQEFLKSFANGWRKRDLTSVEVMICLTTQRREFQPPRSKGEQQ